MFKEPLIRNKANKKIKIKYNQLRVLFKKTFEE